MKSLVWIALLAVLMFNRSLYAGVPPSPTDVMLEGKKEPCDPLGLTCIIAIQGAATRQQELDKFMLRTFKESER